jgi:hypothetical protein
VSNTVGGSSVGQLYTICVYSFSLTMVDTAGATGGAVHKQRPLGVCMCFVEREHMLQWLAAVLPTRAHRPHAQSSSA